MIDDGFDWWGSKKQSQVLLFRRGRILVNPAACCFYRKESIEENDYMEVSGMYVYCKDPHYWGRKVKDDMGIPMILGTRSGRPFAMGINVFQAYGTEDKNLHLRGGATWDGVDLLEDLEYTPGHISFQKLRNVYAQYRLASRRFLYAGFDLWRHRLR